MQNKGVILLSAQITNFSYQKCYKESLQDFDFSDISAFDINDLPSKCLVSFGGKSVALSKWVSPKRTRSYPYARVYDTFDCGVSKVATIIPLIKDEGANGDMDYLQWDSISLMSLLNVYVVLGFYDSAEAHTKRVGKITNQKFNNDYIATQLQKLANYHQSALHWNLNQLSTEILTPLLDSIKKSYAKISHTLNIPLHNPKNINRFADKILQSKNAFMEFSRTKAKEAQERESHTIQPKEEIGIGQKAKIVIQNYLGGQYFFTIDDVFIKNGVLHLCESKHSKNALLPSSDDIKDGLLKLMLYNNLATIKGYKKFKVILRLTSSVLDSRFVLPSEDLESFIAKNNFSNTQKIMLESLNLESRANNFEIWINND